MSTPEDKIARLIRSELEAKLGAWKAERGVLIESKARIAELDALIALVEDETRTSFVVTKREVTKSPLDKLEKIK